MFVSMGLLECIIRMQRVVPAPAEITELAGSFVFTALHVLQPYVPESSADFDKVKGVPMMVNGALQAILFLIVVLTVSFAMTNIGGGVFFGVIIFALFRLVTVVLQVVQWCILIWVEKKVTFRKAFDDTIKSPGGLYRWMCDVVVAAVAFNIGLDMLGVSDNTNVLACSLAIVCFCVVAVQFVQAFAASDRYPIFRKKLEGFELFLAVVRVIVESGALFMVAYISLAIPYGLSKLSYSTTLDATNGSTQKTNVEAVGVMSGMMVLGVGVAYMIKESSALHAPVADTTAPDTAYKRLMTLTLIGIGLGMANVGSFATSIVTAGQQRQGSSSDGMATTMGALLGLGMGVLIVVVVLVSLRIFNEKDTS